MKWFLKTFKIKELRKNEDNPRKISKDQADRLQVSIERFGLCQPIVAHQDGKIIGGHQRFEILKRMGEEDVEVFVPDGDIGEEETKELMLFLNKISGHWDDDMLANCWDLDILLNCGFSRKELGLEDMQEDIREEPHKLTVTFNCDNPSAIQDIKTSIAKLVQDYTGRVTYKTKEK